MSGKLTLATRGIQDRWLTEEPEYSHFVSRFRRHTKFAFEQVEIPFDRFQEPGSEATARIQNNTGDMLKGVTLSLDLPPPYSKGTTTHTVSTSAAPPVLTVDGVDAPSYPIYQGKTYVFYSTFTLTLDDGGSSLPYEWSYLGNDLYELKIPVITGDYTGFSIVYSSYSMSLDVRQFRWKEKSMPSKLIQYADLFIGGQLIQRITGDYVYMYNQLNYTDNDTNFTLVPTTLHNSDLLIYDDYYDKYNKFQKYKIQLPFYFNRHPSLAIPTCGLDVHTVEVKVKLRSDIDNLVGEYSFDNQTMYLTTGAYAPSCSMIPRNMSLYCDFVYVTPEEKNFILTRPIEYVITQTQMSEIRMKAGVTKRAVMINFQHPVKELFFLARDDITREHIPIKHVNLKSNNNDVIDADNLLLSAEQPLRHYTNSIDTDNEFGVYSFSMKPDVHYPTGQVNMSRVIHKLLEVELDVNSTTHSHTLHVYATNYNVLRVSGGMAGLKF